MKYKNGDKILCIKDFFMINGIRRFSKNKTYKINFVQNESYSIINDVGNSHTMDKDLVYDHFTRNREDKFKRILNENR